MTKLEREIQKYLNLRKSMGQKLQIVELYLNQFAKFMESKKKTYITQEFAVKWTTSSKKCQKEQLRKRYNAVRMFSEFWAQYEPNTEVLPKDLFKCSIKRRTPYIFSPGEIKQLLTSVNSAYSNNKYKASLYHTLFGLISLTGMRHGEALNLKIDDIDFKQRTLFIDFMKDRSRYIPLHSSTLKKLQQFLTIRSKLKNIYDKESVFISEHGKQVKIFESRKNFTELLKTNNINGHLKKPMVLDLRHSFAVNTLIKWYKKNIDVNKNILYLSAYLGHEGPHSTYWYLSNVPELTGLAARRFEFSTRKIS